jgi:metal-responsive CopG/Arc/MetJ family transcriptional regulator
MTRSTRIVNMSVDEGLYAQVDRFAAERGTSRSQVLREALARYVASETRWEELLRWGEDSAARAGIRSDADVERTIHEYRDERR